MIRKVCVLGFAVGVSMSGAYAQLSDTVANINSIEQIPYYEQLYKYRVDRVIDLGERQNAGFKSRQSDIADFLIKSIQNGKLNVYNDALNKILTVSETLNKSTVELRDPWDPKQTYLNTEVRSYEGVNYASTRNDNTNHLPTDAAWWEKSDENTETFKPDEIVGIKLVEDVIFDKRRSRLFYDIQAIGILAQRAGEDQMNPRGFIVYKDFYKLVNAYAHSKNMEERNLVLWRNRYNPAENRTYSDAFKLRLFHGVIERVENPDDQTITAIFRSNNRTAREAVYARWEEEMKMMEKEHNLWEY